MSRSSLQLSPSTCLFLLQYNAVFIAMVDSRTWSWVWWHSFCSRLLYLPRFFCVSGLIFRFFCFFEEFSLQLHWICILSPLTWFATFIDLYVSDFPWTSGIEWTWSWWMSSLMCFWVQVVSILLRRTFASALVREVGLQFNFPCCCPFIWFWCWGN